MTISTAATPLSFSGDDATVNFAISWAYQAKGDVVATLRDSTGAETTWVLDTDYTLTAAGASGTLTATTAPATGEKLVITLEPANTQSTDIPTGGDLNSANVEDGLDYLSMLSAKLNNFINRALLVPRTDTRSGTQLEMPNETDRASKYLSFDANGDPIASSGPTGDSSIPVSSFVETLLDDASATAFLATLGITSTAAELNIMDGVTATAAELNAAADVSGRLVSVTDTAAYTVLAANSGKPHTVPNLTASCTFTMPAEASGLEYEFIYRGVAADAQNWVFDTGSDTNYFIGGLVHLDTDAGSGGDEIVPIAGDGNSNSKLTIVTPDVGTRIKFVCDGTLWIISGYVVSATVPSFADQ